MSASGHYARSTVDFSTIPCLESKILSPPIARHSQNRGMEHSAAHRGSLKEAVADWHPQAEPTSLGSMAVNYKTYVKAKKDHGYKLKNIPETTENYVFLKLFT